MTTVHISTVPLGFSIGQLVQVSQSFGTVIDASLHMRPEGLAASGVVVFDHPANAHAAVTALPARLRLTGVDVPLTVRVVEPASPSLPLSLPADPPLASGLPAETFPRNILAEPPVADSVTPTASNGRSSAAGNQKGDCGGRKLYVAGLPIPTTTDAVASFFSEMGAVESVFLLHAYGNPTKQRGAGFVTYEKVADADRAAEYFAAPRTMAGGWHFLTVRRAIGEPPPPPGPQKLFVGRLGVAMNESHLLQIFSPYGEVATVVVLRDRATGQSRRSAFVQFRSADAAKLAIRGVHHKVIAAGQDSPLEVRFAQPPRPRESSSTAATLPVTTGPGAPAS
eukprot:TRINITY_DN69235_c0_g1_i1.p1 TRINITY_DN69235_c0_g1~~TRINITY_DN69235_c0_g1_i1.p1  ORF type:complete len:338 (+),score=23.57 TRINITY_DN69235_c0_g1_i1:199-1212(+)